MRDSGGGRLSEKGASPGPPPGKRMGGFLIELSFGAVFWEPRRFAFWGSGGASADAENFASAEARRGTEPVWQLSDRLRHPFGLPLIDWYCTQALEGRGGSVSRRDHNQATRNRAHAAWAHKPEETYKPIPSYSSGEGVWGRGASLREAASPPRIPTRISSTEMR